MTVDDQKPLAFPSPPWEGKDKGMMLRDYFATKALVGLLSKYGFYSSNELLAEKCYEVADAMLNAREL